MFKSANFTLFDIKLKSRHKDIVLIKGNEFDCESIPFEGSIKLSIPESTHIKKIKLALIGEFNMEYIDRSASATSLDATFERLCVLKVEWPNLLTNDHGTIIYGNYGDTAMRYSKVESSKFSKQGTVNKHGKHHLRSNSSPSLKNSSLIQIAKSGVDGTPFKGLQFNSNHSFFLPRGNYNIPFSVLLPSTLSETVEGLSCASLLYRLECTIEKGRFEKPITKSKHIRIVRTLHPQSLNLVDSIDIDNTWLGKIQYNVKLSRKGVAIGSTIPIHLTFIPMTKGLSLKCIKGLITQQFTFKIPGVKTPDFEQIIGKQELVWSNLSQGYAETSSESWNIKTSYKVPNTLKGLNQSCEFKHNLIRVKHRLKLSIILNNKDGHLSELRANLPIWIYISANTGHVIGNHYEINFHNGSFVQIPGKQDVYFKKDKQWLKSQISSPNESMDEEEEEAEIDLDREDQAPPLYNHHVYDPLYDSTVNKTPHEQLGEALKQTEGHLLSPQPLASITGYFDIPTSKTRSKLFSSTPLDIINKIPTYEEALDEEDEEPVFGSLELAPVYNDYNISRFSDSDVDISSINGHSRSMSELHLESFTHSSSVSPTGSFKNGSHHKSHTHLSLGKVLSKRK
jgi:hypothetical protein